MDFTDNKVKATHISNTNKKVPFFNLPNNGYFYNTSSDVIHSVKQFSLDNSNTLEIEFGNRSKWQSVCNKIFNELNYKIDCDEVNLTGQIKEVKFKDLECFFSILQEEQDLAPIDFETKIAFVGFGKTPLSQHLKAINFDMTKLPEKFFDNIITREDMNDPITAIARIDGPLSIVGLIPNDGAKGRHIYDQKKLRIIPQFNSELRF